uniref:WD and tetratricopeptide repeats protein 1 n=1 Tax=Clastoptera arizonana TaxID=38151 RepID=A0A1B6D964_9HEMI
MSMANRKNITTHLNNREINERINGNFQRHFHVTEDLINRMGLEKELVGHQGCVNCLEWDSNGRLLASASDDYKVILWDPFRYRQVQTISTGHNGNIFSVKFLPLSDDNIIITGAGDYQVHVHDITLGETTQVCTCATSRVKRIAVAPQVPYMFWSASEDGGIRQIDIRTPHTCSEDVKNVLIDLTSYLGKLAEAKCLAINPMRPELIAVGTNDPYVRLYDRRMLKLTNINKQSENVNLSRRSSLTEDTDFENNLSEGCVEYYVPGNLNEHIKHKKFRTLTATYITFNSNGIDLLLNLGGDLVYLFDITKKRPPKAFDIPLSSLSKESCSSSNVPNNGYHVSPRSYLCSNQESVSQPLPLYVETIKQTANIFYEKKDYTKAIRLYNEAISHSSLSAVLYGNRAAALMKRNWVGDMYAALRDCHTTLLLDPNHIKALFRLARCLYELKWSDKAKACLQAFTAKYPSHANSKAFRALENDINLLANNPHLLVQGNDNSESENAPSEDILNYDQECRWRIKAYDYEKRFYGHCNITTDIKEANFFGSEGQYIVAGSDDGSIYIWERSSTNNVQILKGDSSIVNCLQPHPTYCMLVTSGIDPLVRLWSPLPEDGQKNPREVKNKDHVVSLNQQRMKTDPFDIVFMNMAYPESNQGPISCRTS